MMEKEYAVYRGDEFLMMGTTDECVDYLGLTKTSFHYYHSPSYIRRLEEREVTKAIVVVKLEGWDSNEDEF